MVERRTRLALLAAFLVSPLTEAGTSAAVTLDTPAFEAFVEEHFHGAMERAGVVGATVAVVHGGETLVLQGYGTRDLASGAPVDPETTLFRLGSITKPMTALAVLRRVEEGALDLDTDVNTYLRRTRVPTTYPEPITLRHLLTHSAGLDGDMSFSTVGPLDTPTSLSDGVIQRRLHRVRPPGRAPAYDVLGYGLLSLLLEEVNGEPFARVIQSAVFDPLGMERAAVGLPPERIGDIASCHMSTQPGDARTCEHEALSELYQGSGAVAATAADMAALMKGLLRGLRGDGPGPVEAATLAEMADFDRARFHPAWRGIGLGLQELDYAGRRAVGHGGGIQGFSNDMALFPEYDLGIYYGITGVPDQVYDARLSTLSRLMPAPVPAEAREARAEIEAFISRFADRFLPESTPAEPSTTSSRAQAAPVDPKAVAGTYLHGRFVSDNLMVNLARLSLSAEVVARGSELWVDGRGPYEQTQPALFESEDRRVVAFRTSDEGTWISFGREPFATYEKVSPLARPQVSVMPLVPALGLLLTALLYLWPRFAGPRRRAALLWGAGLGLFVLALGIELEYGVLWREVHGAVLRPLLLRLGSWLAVAALLAAPAFALRHRPSPAPARGALRWASTLHLALLGLSGLYLAFFSTFWGLLF